MLSNYGDIENNNHSNSKYTQALILINVTYLRLDLFHMFTWKMVILLLSKKWHEMTWDIGPFSILLHIGNTTGESVK